MTTKPNNEWVDKLKLVKLVVDEDYDELVTNIGSSLSDRNLKRLKDFISKTLQQQREDLIKEIEGVVRESGPDLVLPIKEMPYRDDYINKWNLIKKLQTLRERLKQI
jgi:aminoglycoside phosphotransferase family enzyme